LKLTSSSNDLEGFLALDKLYSSLADPNLNMGRFSTAIVHFDRLVLGFNSVQEATDKATTLGKQMAAKNIRVYVFNVYTPGTILFAPALDALAQQTGGEVLQFAGGANRQSKMESIFTNIKNNGQVYHLQVRARTLAAQYGVAAKGASANDATDKMTCLNPKVLPPPEVQITTPSGDAPTFLKQSDKSITVNAELLNWDGSRQISKVELYSGTTRVDSKDIAPDSAATSFTLNLDVSNLIGGASAQYKLHVKAIDEFGISGDSPEKSIEVIPFVTPVPPTPVPSTVTTPKPVPTATLDPCKVNLLSSPSCVGYAGNVLKDNLIWPVLFILLIVLVVLFRTNARLKNLSSHPVEAISKGIDQVRKTLLGGQAVRQEAIAYLKVLVASPDLVGGKIDIYNNRTSLGRDAKVTDVQLYKLDDKSSVSSLHCTIFYEQGKFFITDDNSTNGTSINGKRLDANEPFELPDGAEIILGDLFRQGAKLQFEVAARGESSAEAEPDDFHVDMPADGDGDIPVSAPVSAPAAPVIPNPPPPSREEVDDYRKTVPGYRDDDLGANNTENFREPDSSPLPPPPSEPGPAKKSIPRTDKKDWKERLG
jgi:hypothetical protein